MLPVMDTHRLASIVLVLPWLMLAACSPGSDPAVPEDGETGVGLFRTPWGPLQLDYVWRGGLMVHDHDLVLDPASRIDGPARSGDEPDPGPGAGGGLAEG